MIAKTGKRNQSSLIPFDQVIREARNQNPPTSYTKICEILLEKHNLKIAPSSVFNYVKVRSKPRPYFKMLPLQTSLLVTEKEPEINEVRRAQLEEKKRVDQSRAENEAFLRKQALIEKRSFNFDPAKPIELKATQP